MEADALAQSKNFLKRMVNESTSPENFIHSCLAGNYSIKPEEVKGEVCDWVLNYLEQSSCPHQLAVIIAVNVAAQISASVNSQLLQENEDDSYPSVAALALQKETYTCLLNVMSKLGEDLSKMICDLEKTLPFSSSIFAIKNKRRKMEDRHTVIHDLNSLLNLEKSPPHCYYAVFDGHGGIDVANYAAAHLHENMVQHPDFFTDTFKAIKEAYKLTDAQICDRSIREGVKGGCTVISALIREKTLYLSWCGDSQSILIQKGKPQVLADPHKPNREDEKKRIEDCGGFVCHVGTWRVNGALAVSRSLGDHEFKPYISSEPDINIVDLDGSEDFLILACDGLWDSMTPEEVTSELYRSILDQSDDDDTCVKSLSEKLVHRSKVQGSEDNISVIVVLLRDIAQIRLDAESFNISTMYINGKSDNYLNSSNEQKLHTQNHIVERPKDLQDITSFPSLDMDQYAAQDITGFSNLNDDQCAASNSPAHGLATSLPPEATALSELPTPPIDDIAPTKEFSELNYAEQMEQLQSHLEARGFQGTSFGEYSPTEANHSQFSTDVQGPLETSPDFYTTEVSNNTVFPNELSVRDATPEKAAMDMASHIINTTLETAVERVQLANAASPESLSSNLNPNAEPFIMKNFSCDLIPTDDLITGVDSNLPLQINTVDASDAEIHSPCNKSMDLQESNEIQERFDSVESKVELVAIKTLSLNDDSVPECLPNIEPVVPETNIEAQLLQECEIEQLELMTSVTEQVTSVAEEASQLKEQCIKNISDLNLCAEQPIEQLDPKHIVDTQEVELVIPNETNNLQPGLEDNTNVKCLDIENMTDHQISQNNEKGEMFENSHERNQLIDGDKYHDRYTGNASEDASLKDVNPLESESSIDDKLSSGDISQQTESENLKSPIISKQVIGSDSLLPKEVQDELLKITENPPSENVTDDSQTAAVAVDLKTIPDGVPEADGVSEDIDSDSEKDGGWSYVKASEATVPKTTDSKASATKVKKLTERKTAAPLLKLKKEPAKPVKDAVVKNKPLGIVDKLKKPSMEKKTVDVKTTSSLKSTTKLATGTTLTRTKPPINSTNKVATSKPDMTKPTTRTITKPPASTSQTITKTSATTKTSFKSTVSTTKPTQPRTVGNLGRPPRPTSATTTLPKISGAVSKPTSTLTQAKPSTTTATVSEIKTSVLKKPFRPTTIESKVQPRKPLTLKKEIKDEKNVANKQIVAKKTTASTIQNAQKTPLFSSTPKPNLLKSTVRAPLPTKISTNVRSIPSKQHVGLKPPRNGPKMDKSAKSKKEIDNGNKAKELDVTPETKDNPPEKEIETKEKFTLETNTEKSEQELIPNDTLKQNDISNNEIKQNEINVEVPDNLDLIA